MPLSKEQKLDKKARFARMVEDLEHFANGDVKTLYVIDIGPMLKAAEAMGELMKRLPKASWTRGKQGHGR